MFFAIWTSLPFSAITSQISFANYRWNSVTVIHTFFLTFFLRIYLGWSYSILITDVSRNFSFMRTSLEARAYENSTYVPFGPLRCYLQLFFLQYSSPSVPFRVTNFSPLYPFDCTCFFFHYLFTANFFVVYNFTTTGFDNRCHRSFFALACSPFHNAKHSYLITTNGSP